MALDEAGMHWRAMRVDHPGRAVTGSDRGIVADRDDAAAVNGDGTVLDDVPSIVHGEDIGVADEERNAPRRGDG